MIVADPQKLLNNAEVRESLEIPAGSSVNIEETQIQAIQELETYIGRYFARRDDFIWNYRIRRPKHTIYLGLIPTLSIATVILARPGITIANGDVMVLDTDYQLVDDYRSQIQKLNNITSSFSDFIVDDSKFRKGNLRVTMNGGYGPKPTGSPDNTVALPIKIKRAILNQMQFIIERNQVKGSKLIASALSIGDGGSVNMISPKNIHPQSQLDMNGYRQFWQ